MARVEEALADKGISDEAGRRAHFACALALAWPDGHVETFEGAVHGTLVRPPRGKRGFGYDPMFRPDGHDATFGEFDPAAKHRSEEHTSELQSLMRISYAVFCLKKKNQK